MTCEVETTRVYSCCLFERISDCEGSLPFCLALWGRERCRPVEKACCSPFSPGEPPASWLSLRKHHVRHHCPWKTIAFYLCVLCSTSDFFIFLGFILIWVLFVLFFVCFFLLLCLVLVVPFPLKVEMVYISKNLRFLLKEKTTKTHQ